MLTLLLYLLFCHCYYVFVNSFVTFYIDVMVIVPLKGKINTLHFLLEVSTLT